MRHPVEYLRARFRRASPYPSRARKLLSCLVLVAVIFGLWASAKIAAPAPPPSVEGRLGADPPAAETLNALCLLRLQFEDVLISKQDGLRWVAGAWSVYGDATIGIDWTRVRSYVVEPGGRRVRLVLPPPQIVGSRIDHDRTIAYMVSRGWFAGPEREAEQRATALRAAADQLAAHARTRCESADTRVRLARRVRRGYAAAGWIAEIDWADRTP